MVNRLKDNPKVTSNVLSEVTAGVSAVAEAFFSIAKLVLVILIAIIVWEYRSTLGPYLVSWMERTTHFSVLGISIDRQLSAERTITQIVNRNNPSLPVINAIYARAAVTRASKNAAAIIGSRILWVDGHPENNQEEASILTDMGVEVRRALNTSEALKLLPGFSPELIISNLIRDGDQSEPLKNCPAYYLEIPQGVPTTLTKLNDDTMKGTGRTTGFSMAEAISKVAPVYTDHAQPRLIFYSASAGSISASQCARVVTNRVDVLLQTVVSALEELRWDRLQAAN